jgi:hypothetical protein
VLRRHKLRPLAGSVLGRAFRAGIADRIQEFADLGHRLIRRQAGRGACLAMANACSRACGSALPSPSRAPRIRGWRRLPAARGSPSRAACGWPAVFPSSSASISLLPGRILWTPGSFLAVSTGQGFRNAEAPAFPPVPRPVQIRHRGHVRAAGGRWRSAASAESRVPPARRRGGDRPVAGGHPNAFRQMNP